MTLSLKTIEVVQPKREQLYQKLAWPSWTSLTREQADRIGLSPNRPGTAAGTSSSFVRSQQQRRVLHHRGRRRLLPDAIAANRIATCTVRLVDGLDDVVGKQSLGAVAAKLRAAPVNVGWNGGYWGSIATSMSLRAAAPRRSGYGAG